MSLKIDKALVSADWLFKNLNNENLVILDASISKVIAGNEEISAYNKQCIKGAIYFDIKNTFSDQKAGFPNTVLSPKEFEESAQRIGICKDSCIVVYDDLGIYSSPRVWWMFQLMGFKNIAVLDGGFSYWKYKKYPTEYLENYPSKKGNFTASYQPQRIKFTNDVYSAIENKTILIVDARSKGRFYAKAPEPRLTIKGGHIPNSVNLPYTEIIENGMLKSEKELKLIFNTLNKKKKAFIFSCGSGITASILALGAELSGIKNHAVYDGSWTEWSSTEGLPIKK
ncbi:MAG: sulfurtransferase [Polaribacter sp.]|nr:sulfurtransferase [Polaribacter sp.]